MLLLIVRLFRKMSTFMDYRAIAIDVDVDGSARVQLLNRLVHIARRHWLNIFTRNDASMLLAASQRGSTIVAATDSVGIVTLPVYLTVTLSEHVLTLRVTVLTHDFWRDMAVTCSLCNLTVIRVVLIVFLSRLLILIINFIDTILDGAVRVSDLHLGVNVVRYVVFAGCVAFTLNLALGLGSPLLS